MMALHSEVAFGYTPLVINLVVQVLNESMNRSLTKQDIKDKITGEFSDDTRNGCERIIPYLTEYAEKE